MLRVLCKAAQIVNPEASQDNLELIEASPAEGPGFNPCTPRQKQAALSIQGLFQPARVTERNPVGID